MFALIITDSTGKNILHPLPPEEGRSYSLGRSEECDIPLPDEVHLSRVHCLLTVHEQQIYLQDNNSSNGIYVGSRRLTSERMVLEREYKAGLCTLVLIRAIPDKEHAASTFHFDSDEAPTDLAETEEEPSPPEVQDTSVSAPELQPPAPAPAPAAPPRLPRCGKATPRPLRGVHKSVAPERPRPPHKPFLTAAGTAPGTPPPSKKQLRNPAENTAPRVQHAPSQPGDSLGLPTDFELRMRLMNTTPTLPAGTALRFAITASEHSYFYLVQYDCHGTPTLLVPGLTGDDNRVFAHTEMQFPHPCGNEYELIVEAPLGHEMLIGIACTDSSAFERHWRKIIATGAATPGQTELQAIQQCTAPATRWASAIMHITTGN